MSAFSETAKRTKQTGADVACQGKVAFDGYRQATAVINRHQTKARPGRSCYRCGHCQKWHIGTDGGAVEKRKAKDFKERKHHE